MKKIKLILIAGILLCLSCEKIMAQMPYKSSVGGVICPTVPFMGVGGLSFKSFSTNHIVYQTDIYLKIMMTAYGEGTLLAFYTSCVTNTNVMYQKKVKNSNWFWFMGGGVSMGFTLLGDAKFGANIITGVEYVFDKKPLAIQMDIRPGYGILFSSFSKIGDNGWLPEDNPWHHFDWMAGFTLRYTFKGKKLEE